MLIQVNKGILLIEITTIDTLTVIIEEEKEQIIIHHRHRVTATILETAIIPVPVQSKIMDHVEAQAKTH